MRRVRFDPFELSAESSLQAFNLEMTVRTSQKSDVTSHWVKDNPHQHAHTLKVHALEEAHSPEGIHPCAE